MATDIEIPAGQRYQICGMKHCGRPAAWDDSDTNPNAPYKFRCDEHKDTARDRIKKMWRCEACGKVSKAMGACQVCGTNSC